MAYRGISCLGWLQVSQPIDSTPISYYNILPANIYFPAIPTIAKAFHKSIELTNQTVTIYLVC